MLGVKLTEYLSAEERAKRTLEEVGVETVKPAKRKPRKQRFSKARGVIRKGAKIARKAGKLTGEAARATQRAGSEARKEMRAAGREFGRSGPTRRERSFLQQDVFLKPRKKKKKRKHKKKRRKGKRKRQRVRQPRGLSMNDVIGF